jgi:hypothetical protein
MFRFMPQSGSKNTYRLLPEAGKHTLVVTDNLDTEKWSAGAAALLYAGQFDLTSLVVDILANPQIRVIVIDSAGDDIVEQVTRLKSSKLGEGLTAPIKGEHLALVNQYIDVYFEQYHGKFPLPPFYPSPIKYDIE